jgi:hypothetical protein
MFFKVFASNAQLIGHSEIFEIPTLSSINLRNQRLNFQSDRLSLSQSQSDPNRKQNENRMNRTTTNSRGAMEFCPVRSMERGINRAFHGNSMEQSTEFEDSVFQSVRHDFVKKMEVDFSFSSSSISSSSIIASTSSTSYSAISVSSPSASSFDPPLLNPNEVCSLTFSQFHRYH